MCIPNRIRRVFRHLHQHLSNALDSRGKYRRFKYLNSNRPKTRNYPHSILLPPSVHLLLGYTIMSPSNDKPQPFTPTVHEDWLRTDLYHNSYLHTPDDALEHALQLSDERGLPRIAVSTTQGKFLNLLARSVGAKRILEVGTLGGLVLLDCCGLSLYVTVA